MLNIFWATIGLLEQLITPDSKNSSKTVDITFTAWKVSKYGVFSGPYFPTFGLNMERYGVSLRIQSEFGKIRTTKNSAFGHFSRSVIVCHLSKIYLQLKRKAWLYLDPDFQFFFQKHSLFYSGKRGTPCYRSLL